MHCKYFHTPHELFVSTFLRVLDPRVDNFDITSGSSTTNQPQQPGGLFGSTQQTKPSISLFGSSTNTSQPQQTTSLFGRSTPNQGSGLFGSQPTNNQAQQGGGLFGGQSSQQQGGGLFGSQPNEQQGGGPFGTNNAQRTQPQQGSSLFSTLGQSESQYQQQQQGAGLFGGLGNQNKTSALSVPRSLSLKGYPGHQP